MTRRGPIAQPCPIPSEPAPTFTIKFIGDPTGSTATMHRLTGAGMLAKTRAADAAFVFYEVTKETP